MFYLSLKNKNIIKNTVNLFLYIKKHYKKKINLNYDFYASWENNGI